MKAAGPATCPRALAYLIPSVLTRGWG
jgi:hypothetical protein